MKIGREHFNGGMGEGTEGFDRAHKMGGATVGKIVPGDAGDDHMFQPQSGSGLGDAMGFRGVQGLCFPFFHGTKTAPPRADLAHDHEGRCSPGVALHAIGAFGVLTDRGQVQGFHQSGGEMIAVTLGNLPLQPAR